MDEGLNNIQPLSPFIPRDLEYGQWELFCPECGWRAGKMTACKPFCPDCRTRLHEAAEFGERYHARSEVTVSEIEG